MEIFVINNNNHPLSLPGCSNGENKGFYFVGLILEQSFIVLPPIRYDACIVVLLFHSPLLNVGDNRVASHVIPCVE